ncbi:hypothetical protein DYB28_014756 [Aphanomyces astaci]|uniref:Uncharacterized protein n=1 Tax=Aphanomyces astaci TaxID=112090 RepID=A0A397AZP2_APHAT|nr:hypothetical protein DYB36_000965 [Aphanomyces astaci]RHY37718.1 hypothetical protein DYB34_001902 [Aphanomyces astaci]RHY88659.1 hypothetical protein DYB26_005915 [Aphanomyces astaci]RLO11811.1 hypothetical protein DYB28_014756 [Aphanomyces astaci]
MPRKVTRILSRYPHDDDGLAQVVLVKKSPNAAEVMSFLSSCGPFTCKQVDKCPVDLMFCAQARTFPAIPFMFITSATSDVVAVTKERARHATTLFPFVHAIILFPSALSPRTFRELQSLHLNQDLSDKIQIVPASSIETAVHFMLSVRSKQSFQAQERTAEFYARSKSHTVRILQSNMPFLHEDECEMLLDVFGRHIFMCQRRVNQRIMHDLALRNRVMEETESKKAKNYEVSLRAAHTATERIKAKKRRELKALDDGVEVLILNQPSSIEAMNIARMLSPRFAEIIAYTPDIAKNSADDVRLKGLLDRDRVGSYYR